ncbi:MAG TPA: hypothetical protein VFN30_12705 [Chitinophagaceae bacterium]|nr:hypothetical protein [Chitinophagaceae bacterium]
MKRMLFTLFSFLLLRTTIVASGGIPPKFSTATLSKSISAQCNFSFVRGHRHGSGTALQWGMDGDCAVKFYVLRSYDYDPYDPYAIWENVSEVTANNSRMYGTSDKSVFPGLIHYQIIAIMNDGSSVSSDIKSIRIVKKN